MLDPVAKQLRTGRRHVQIAGEAVDIAVEAARKVLAGKVDSETGFQSSLQQVKANLN